LVAASSRGLEMPFPISATISSLQIPREERENGLAEDFPGIQRENRPFLWRPEMEEEDEEAKKARREIGKSKEEEAVGMKKEELILAILLRPKEDLQQRRIREIMGKRMEELLNGEGRQKDEKEEGNTQGGEEANEEKEGKEAEVDEKETEDEFRRRRRPPEVEEKGHQRRQRRTFRIGQVKMEPIEGEAEEGRGLEGQKEGGMSVQLRFPLEDGDGHEAIARLLEIGPDALAQALEGHSVNLGRGRQFIIIGIFSLFCSCYQCQNS
jgi:hypothetical protein